jgi:hypothetical protein
MVSVSIPPGLKRRTTGLTMILRLHLIGYLVLTRRGVLGDLVVDILLL